jgi:hypothetical protein
MRGFLIHTTDQHLLCRNYEYIKYDNPGWWQENIHIISSFWEFDTDKLAEMKPIFESLSRISRQGLLPVIEVKLFCESVGFDLEKFMQENATQEARFAKVSKQNWDSVEKTASGGFGEGSAIVDTKKSGSGD